MSDKYFVDTNILLYAHDRSSGSKHLRAKALLKELWRSGCGVLSTQVLQEFCVDVRKKIGAALPPGEISAIVQDYLKWKVVVNAPESIYRALDLESRYGVSFWDALILQAAEEAGANTLYSEDLNPGQLYGSVRVIDPLRDSFVVPF